MNGNRTTVYLQAVHDRKDALFPGRDLTNLT